MAMASPLYSNLRSILKEHGLPDQGPAKATEITLPAGLISKDKMKDLRRTALETNPDRLFVDYKFVRCKKKKEQKKIKTNFLFHTELGVKVWLSALRDAFPHRKEGAIDHGRQVKVSEQPDSKRPELTINVYNTGTVMVQGGGRHLDEFEKNFLNLKKVVEQRKAAKP